MTIIQRGKYTQLIAAEGMFITDLEETMVVESIMGRNLVVSDFREIDAVEAEEIRQRLRHENGEDGIEGGADEGETI